MTHLISTLKHLQIWVQNSFLLELSNLIQSLYYDDSENLVQEGPRHENSSADPEENNHGQGSRLDTLNNYLTWRAVQPFISYLGKGKYIYAIPTIFPFPVMNRDGN